MSATNCHESSVTSLALVLNLKRRAVRLAYPAQRIASRKKGRRDALPYFDVGPVQDRKARQTAGGVSPRLIGYRRRNLLLAQKPLC